MRIPFVALFAVLLAYPLRAAPPTTPGDTPTADELSSIFRTLMTATLPSPIIEQDYNWGHQRMVANGVTWEKSGIFLKPQKQEKLKDDGVWRRIRIDAINPDKNLIVKVANVQKAEKGRLTFDMAITLPARIKFEQQLWKAGVRVYSGETRARCKTILLLQCESTTKVTKSDSFIPDVAFRMRVLDARLTYDDFVVEHTAGVGGEVAEALGDALHNTVKQVKPSLEKNMLEKANKAIVKAGDTKEVKLGIGKLLDGK
jgi:hypothetical protein